MWLRLFGVVFLWVSGAVAFADVWVRDFSAWTNVYERLNEYKKLSISSLWLAPPFKGSKGVKSDGFDVYDYGDLGNKFQRWTVSTRYGDLNQLVELVNSAHHIGLKVYLTLPIGEMGFASSGIYPGFSRADFVFESYSPVWKKYRLNLLDERVRRKIADLIYRVQKKVKPDGWVVFTRESDRKWVKKIFNDERFYEVDFRFSDEMMTYAPLNTSRRILSIGNPISLVKELSSSKFVVLSDFYGNSSYFHRALFFLSLCVSKNVILDGKDVLSPWGRRIMEKGLSRLKSGAFVRFFDCSTLAFESAGFVVVVSSSCKRRKIRFPVFLGGEIKVLRLGEDGKTKPLRGVRFEKGDIENFLEILVDWRGTLLLEGGG